MMVSTSPVSRGRPVIRPSSADEVPGSSASLRSRLQSWGKLRRLLGPLGSFCLAVQISSAAWGIGRPRSNAAMSTASRARFSSRSAPVRAGERLDLVGDGPISRDHPQRNRGFVRGPTALLDHRHASGFGGHRRERHADLHAAVGPAHRGVGDRGGIDHRTDAGQNVLPLLFGPRPLVGVRGDQEPVHIDAQVQIVHAAHLLPGGDPGAATETHLGLQPEHVPDQTLDERLEMGGRTHPELRSASTRVPAERRAPARHPRRANGRRRRRPRAYSARHRPPTPRPTADLGAPR